MEENVWGPALQNLPIAIIISDEHGLVLEVNVRATECFGYSRDELVGRSIDVLVPERYRFGHGAHRRKYGESGQPRLMGRGMSLFGLRKDGREIPLEISLATFSGPQGTLISTAIVDISHRLKVEEQLRLAQRLDSVRQLTAGIAHNFNNILTIVKGNAKLAIAELPQGHSALSAAQEIETATTRAMKIVSELSAFARENSSPKKGVDVNSTVVRAAELLRQSVAPHIQIRTKLTEPLGVALDQNEVEQIVINLGSNAADSMRDRGGVITLAVDFIQTDGDLSLTNIDLKEGDYCLIVVSDSGCGMGPNIISRMFEPFFTTKPIGQGYGLGLSAVNGLVKSYGGAISVESTPDKGSSISVYLPVCDLSAADVHPRKPSRLRNADGRARHILYVDDEQPLVFLVTRALEKIGYVVTGVTDPREAVEMITRDPENFDAVVSDLSMPYMSGMVLARKIRTVCPTIPILVMSGYVLENDIEEAHALGIPPPIHKPDVVEDFGRAIDNLFKDCLV